MPEVFHALGLHMHQPPGNLLALHNSGERWEAKQILWYYDRVTRMLDPDWGMCLKGGWGLSGNRLPGDRNMQITN